MGEAEKYAVGILCHGQLAMMTGEAANRMNVSAVALGPGENSPASHAIDVFQGDFNNREDVFSFAQHVNSLVLDTDHVNTAPLIELHDNGLLIVPNPRVTRTIQNRILLKQALNNAGIPTAPWMPAYSRQELDEAFSNLKGDVIVKTAEQGFDGRGNRSVKTTPELDDAWEDLQGEELIVEERLEIQKELAMMLARDTNDFQVFYPLVESFHEDGMLEYTFYPSGVDEQTERQAERLGRDVLRAFSGPALIGMELIWSQEGQLVVNEIAGRPHNTGHYSIEACRTSQFENLVRIATGETVGPTYLTQPDKTIVMRNLNGGTLEEISESDYERVRDLDGELHWYHKSPRPRRKRGHITLFGPDRESVSKNAETAIEAIAFNG